MTEIGRSLRDSSFARYRNAACRIIEILEAFTPAEMLAVIELAKAEMQLQLALHSGITNQSREQNRHEDVFNERLRGCSSVAKIEH
jgi:hypothetical protein